ncbi:type II toxin-antitoxin system RelE/ParE family toxin [Photorhabdus africana]|uniref:type II toxin-antitoxin system RelE/ParE family toxin n=1 Tax=Photorhabdus africana TaxID=3097554 RepID=UPI002B40E652|nr:type II toxin-antitoxin system RelE/ParE family toxin [Photorhabdus sp. CRI-LC]
MIYKVQITETAYQTLSIIEDYKANTIGLEAAQNLVDDLLIESSERIGENPLAYGYCSMLLDKGIQFHQWLSKDRQFRVIYDVVGDEIQILAYASTNQDLIALLYQLLIIH